MFFVLVSIQESAQKLVYKNRETRISMLRISIHTNNNLNLLSRRIQILTSNGSKFVEVKVDAVPSYLQSWSRGICREAASEELKRDMLVEFKDAVEKFSMSDDLKGYPTDILMRSKNFIARICKPEDLNTGTRYDI